jgi:hypothetical protein
MRFVAAVFNNRRQQIHAACLDICVLVFNLFLNCKRADQRQQGYEQNDER